MLEGVRQWVLAIVLVMIFLGPSSCQSGKQPLVPGRELLATTAAASLPAWATRTWATPAYSTVHGPWACSCTMPPPIPAFSDATTSRLRALNMVRDGASSAGSVQPDLCPCNLQLSGLTLGEFRHFRGPTNP
jgi:hypothetical protein